VAAICQRDTCHREASIAPSHTLAPPRPFPGKSREGEQPVKQNPSHRADTSKASAGPERALFTPTQALEPLVNFLAADTCQSRRHLDVDSAGAKVSRSTPATLPGALRCAAIFLCRAETSGVKGAVLRRSSRHLTPAIALHDGTWERSSGLFLCFVP
jgi:hypothetical protein